MGFDLGLAKKRISQELSDLVDELWPKTEKISPKTGDITSDAEHLYHLESRISDRQKRNALFMLYELNRGCYWHAVTNWPSLSAEMEETDQKFYAELMIEQARKDEKFGMVWVVQQYDNQNLRKFISQDVLVKAVNKGFWEIANNFFGGQSTNLPQEFLEAISKHSDLLDLTQFKELRTKPLRFSEAIGWPDKDYKKAFERAKPKSSLEDQAWLACPLIDQEIIWVNNDTSSGTYREKLRRKLKPYQQYLNTSVIQGIFQEHFTLCIKEIDGEEPESALSDARTILEYLVIGKTKDRLALKKLVSDNLPRGIEEYLVDIDFPRDWLTDDCLTRLRKEMIDYAQKSAYRTSRETEEIVLHLKFLQKATEGHWIDPKTTRHLIENGLDAYLKTKARPKGPEVELLITTLDKQYVETSLYRTVYHQAISDLVLRRKPETARRLYKKAEQDGWLDKSRVPTLN